MIKNKAKKFTILEIIKRTTAATPKNACAVLNTTIIPTNINQIPISRRGTHKRRENVPEPITKKIKNMKASVRPFMKSLANEATGTEPIEFKVNKSTKKLELGSEVEDVGFPFLDLSS